MKNRNRMPHKRTLNGELWLLVAVLTLLATIALLHLAVQRELETGTDLVETLALTNLLGRTAK